MNAPKLTFSPNRLTVSALFDQNCVREINLSVPAPQRRYTPASGTLEIYGPGPMSKAAKIVRGFYPKAETVYAAGYSHWRAGLPSAKANHDTAEAAKNAAERVKAAEGAQRAAEQEAAQARAKAEQLAEQLRRTQEARQNESRSWGSRQSSDPTDPYTVLGVQRGAPPEVVAAAYRALSKLFHPDKGGDPDRQKAINDAYDKLRAK